MKLVIKDQNGHEVNFDRVSLIPGGIEIVLGDDIPQSFVEAAGSTEAPVSVAPVTESMIESAPEVPSAAEVAPDAPSVFNTPAVPSPETADTASTVEVDKQGVPWDERIHSSSKKKTAKGVWAKRKNLPEGLHETVTAELLSGQPQPEQKPVTDERPVPITPEVPAVAASAPEIPPLQAAAPAVPTPAAAQQSATPAVPAPLPEGNQVGDPNDLSGILSQWGNS